MICCHCKPFKALEGKISKAILSIYNTDTCQSYSIIPIYQSNKLCCLDKCQKLPSWMIGERTKLNHDCHVNPCKFSNTILQCYAHRATVVKPQLASCMWLTGMILVALQGFSTEAPPTSPGGGSGEHQAAWGGGCSHVTYPGACFPWGKSEQLGGTGGEGSPPLRVTQHFLPSPRFSGGSDVLPQVSNSGHSVIDS